VFSIGVPGGFRARDVFRLSIGRYLGRVIRGAVLVSVLPGCVSTPGPAKPEFVTRAPEAIAVLLSDESPAFRGVARELARQFRGPIQTFRLNGHDNGGSEVLNQVQASDRSVVVAVGLPAARVARRLHGKRVVFCQAFNYEDMQLVTPWMKGVAAVPPPSEQFRYWKQLSPKLARVVVITGGNLGTLLDEGQAAAAKQGIKLVRAQVASDKEMIYTFRRLVRDAQGLWLVPDNRVLSRDVIRELLTFSVKEGKEVMVFSPELLSRGGLLSVETEPDDIAARVIERLSLVGAPGEVPGPAIVPLTRARVRINEAMTARLGLRIPRQLKGSVYAP
jgi:ABC-type uncharacterized transport system substrate-binding protein